MAYPILAPNSTWYKSSTARNTITQINIVNSYTPTGSENESWNADEGNTGSIKCYRTGTVITMAGNGSGKIAMNADSSSMFANFTNLQTITGGNVFDTSNVTSFNKTFQLCSKLESIDVSTWDTSKVTTLNRMFQAASLIGNLNVSNWNVSNVTDMEGFFNMPSSAYYNTRLTSLDTSNWNTGKVTTMRNLLFGCTALTSIEVGGWDVSKVTDLRGSFALTAITSLNVSNWNTSSCTDMSVMFDKCTSLESIDVSKWNVSKVTTMKYMFSQSDYGTVAAPFTELDISNWDTSSCTDMGWMFYGLRNVKTLDVSKWDVSKVTSFHHMFAWCTQLIPQGVENWDTSSAQYMEAMFHGNKHTSLDLSDWDVSNVKDFAQMFERNIYLTEIKGLDKWDTSSGQFFAEMFLGCQSLKELNLSNFDTRNASASFYDEIRGQTFTDGMNNMFGQRLIGEDKATEEYGWMMRLEKITLGENFSFNGDGTAAPAVLPTPDATYISGADGNWYDSTGAAYSVSTITVPNTYYAVKSFALGNISKVEYFGKVLIDLTGDSVTPETLGKGVTAHDKTGAPIVGTMESGGGAPLEEKDVNFYDYDGTLLYSYTVEEAHALTELPALPSHDGLVCQGWNWTLAQVKAVPKAANVGAAYITDDGKTRLYLEWGQDKYRTLTIHFTQTVANGVTIDWGDGSPTETVSGTGAVTATHNFVQSNCVMTLFPSSGCKMTLGRTSSELNLFGGNGSTNKTATNALKKMEVGQNVTALNQHCLFFAGNAETVTIPLAVSVGQGCMRESGLKCIINTDTNGYLCPQQFAQYGIMKVVSFPPNIVTMGAYAFYNASAIENANFVANFQTLYNYGFSGCRLLRTIKFNDSLTTIPIEFVGYSIKVNEMTLPSSLTAIPANAFFELYSIQQLVIPSKVTSIAANALARMYGLGYLKFLPTTPPTVANANAFTGIPTTCVVEVPKGTLATYQAATNYSGIAAQMVESES